MAGRHRQPVKGQHLLGRCGFADAFVVCAGLREMRHPQVLRRRNRNTGRSKAKHHVDRFIEDRASRPTGNNTGIADRFCEAVLL